MTKSIIIFCLIALGVVFGQLRDTKSDTEVLDGVTYKNISVEIFCGKYLTLGDTIHSGSRTQLPFSIWRSGGKVSYQFIPHIAFGAGGGYGLAKNLTGIHSELFPPPEFSLVDVSLFVSYRNRIVEKIQYCIDFGLNTSFTKLLIENNTKNNVYLSPLVVGGLQLIVVSPLYLKLQVESSFTCFVKTGAKDIELGTILPSVYVSSGLKFHLK